MPKYSLERLGPDRFEEMVKALLERQFRIAGKLIQFGDGPDGGREATWEQPVSHEAYRPPKRSKKGPRRWIFQCKFHDASGASSRRVARTLIDDLERELEKIVYVYKQRCDSYVLITNLPLTGVHQLGSRDVVERAAKKWRRSIGDIQVWDAANIASMLDADPHVRQTYLGDILPGDVLAALLDNVQAKKTKQAEVLKVYLTKLLRSMGEARSDEAGDESALRLDSVYVDLSLRLGSSVAGVAVNDAELAWNEAVAFRVGKRKDGSDRAETLITE